MPNYRRAWHPGGTYFFTVNLLQRHGNNLLLRHIDDLREAVRITRRTRASGSDLATKQFTLEKPRPGIGTQSRVYQLSSRQALRVLRYASNHTQPVLRFRP